MLGEKVSYKACTSFCVVQQESLTYAVVRTESSFHL